MIGQDDGRAVALRVPLVEHRVVRRVPPVRAMVLGGILLFSGGMMVATLLVGVSVSHDVRALVARLDKEESARAFDQAALRAADVPRVYVLPALRKHVVSGRVLTRRS